MRHNTVENAMNLLVGQYSYDEAIEIINEVTGLMAKGNYLEMIRRYVIMFPIQNLSSKQLAYGGDPLLNFEVCKQWVTYSKEQAKLHDKIFKFTLTTNSVLVTKVMQKFLDEEDISAVITLDGCKHINDKMKPFSNCSGSYDVGIDKFYQK